MRRHWRHDLADATRAEDTCRTRFEQLTAPERTTLNAALEDAEADALPLRGQAAETTNWLRSHPGVTERIRRIDHELSSETPIARAVDVPHVSAAPPDRDLGIEL
jgi:hypothetical protein